MATEVAPVPPAPVEYEFNVTHGDGTTGRYTLHIDVQGLARYMAGTARANSSRRTVQAFGLIVCNYRGDGA